MLFGFGQYSLGYILVFEDFRFDCCFLDDRCRLFESGLCIL